MRLKVRPFERTVEPSFPENDSLPKKDLDTKKFDTTFSEWWEEVRLNLGRLDDQLQKYIKADLSETIVTQKLEIENNITQEISTVENNVTNITQTNNEQLTAEITTLTQTNEAQALTITQLTNRLNDLEGDLYSISETTSETETTTTSDDASTE